MTEVLKGVHKRDYFEPAFRDTTNGRLGFFAMQGKGELCAQFRRVDFALHSETHSDVGKGELYMSTS